MGRRQVLGSWLSQKVKPKPGDLVSAKSDVDPSSTTSSATVASQSVSTSHTAAETSISATDTTVNTTHLLQDSSVLALGARSEVALSPASGPRPTEPDVDTNVLAPQATTDADPWSRAFTILQEREPKLIADYTTHLTTLQVDGTGADLSAPRSVEALVKRLQEERDKKQWRVSILGTEIKIREQTERLSKLLLWSDPIVKSAVSAQPYAALAWSGVSLLLPLISSGKTQNEAMLKGFNAIGDVQLYWHICEETCLQSDHRRDYKDLIEPLAKLYSYIIEYQARAICHLSKAQLSRAWQDIADPSYWTGIIEKLQASDKASREIIGISREEEIRKNRDQQLQEMHESRTILNEIRRILETRESQTQDIYEDQQITEILQLFASDYIGHKDFNPKRVEGTCEWFFNDGRFREWRDKNVSSLLWVSAGPGCGKSVLSRALIDENRLSTRVTTSATCFFFFKDGYEGRTRITDALCAILHQLFTCDATAHLIKYSRTRYKRQGNSLAHSFHELWQILKECAASPDCGEIVCILDALDECDRPSREAFVEMLKQFYHGSDRLAASSAKLKFLITSRAYDDLEANFGTFATTAYLHFDGDDKSGEIGREINLVIDEHVKIIAANFSASDRKMVSNHLKNMDNRTYLWLYLIIDTIRDNLSRFKKRSSIEALLSSIPPRVFEAYERILSKSQDEKLTEMLLGIMLAAARPLTLIEVNAALTLALSEQIAAHGILISGLWPRTGFQSVAQNLCGLFITVHDSQLSFIHQTAREFLTHSEPEGKWKGRFNLSQSHEWMSQICLRYLLLPDMEHRPIGFNEDISGFPFLSYAAVHWPEHFASQNDTAADRSMQSARMLCTLARCFGFWIISFWRSTHHRPFIYHFESDLALASHLGLKQLVQNILLGPVFEIYPQVASPIWAKNYPVEVRDVTALQAAAHEGHVNILQLLIDAGFDIDGCTNELGTPLAIASQYGHYEIVQLLLKAGACVNPDGVFPPLFMALDLSHYGILQLLLDAGVDMDARRYMEGTPLQAASQYGDKRAVEMFLKAGAAVDIQGRFFTRSSLDPDYGTALYVATREEQEDIVRLLVEAGADLDIEGKELGTALTAALSQGSNAIVQCLVDAGAKINTQNEQFQQGVATALVRGHESTIQILVRASADTTIIVDEFKKKLFCRFQRYPRQQGLNTTL